MPVVHPVPLVMALDDDRRQLWGIRLSAAVAQWLMFGELSACCVRKLDQRMVVSNGLQLSTPSDAGGVIDLENLAALCRFRSKSFSFELPVHFFVGGLPLSWWTRACC